MLLFKRRALQLVLWRLLIGCNIVAEIFRLTMNLRHDILSHSRKFKKTVGLFYSCQLPRNSLEGFYAVNVWYAY